MVYRAKQQGCSVYVAPVMEEICFLDRIDASDDLITLEYSSSDGLRFALCIDGDSCSYQLIGGMILGYDQDGDGYLISVSSDSFVNHH